MTCDQYVQATKLERISYVVARHPATILFGYLTVFMGGMCLRAIWINPIRHVDSLIAMILHVALVIGLSLLGWQYLVLCLMLPLSVSCAIGSYLFYAQHNFPGCKLHHHQKWSYVHAALQSSSYMRMHPLMRWFTGNIGYHHIHHLNAKIPFYKLPRAMASLVELQAPQSTSLRIADICGCFRSNLWDSANQRFVSYREAKLCATMP